MFRHVPAYTYHPNFSDLFSSLVRWLSSPGGNLVWDLFLFVLGIFFTVVILQRYFEQREEMRWRPARQNLYFQLFGDVEWLLGLLPSDVLEWDPRVAYRFGHASHLSEDLDSAFTRKLASLDVATLRSLARELADNPELLEGFKRGLNDTLQHSAAVFLAREPELNRRISRVREHVSRLEGSLEIYRETQGTGRDPARIAGSSAIEQVCIALKMLMIEAYGLRSWLADRADEVRPVKTRP